MIKYLTDMSTLKVLDPKMRQVLNMSFMESTVKIDDNHWDLLDL